MTIQSVGGSHPGFGSPAEAALGAGGFNSLSEELAVMLLNREEQQKHSEHEEVAAAREGYRAALANEVQALRNRADAEFRGALVEGGLAAASGTLGVIGAVQGHQNDLRREAAHLAADQRPDLRTVLSDGLGKLAQPAGTLASHNHEDANAKSAEGQEEQAKWRMDDSRDAIKEAKELQNKALDWVSSMLDRDAATTTAILSNKV